MRSGRADQAARTSTAPIVPAVVSVTVDDVTPTRPVKTPSGAELPEPVAVSWATRSR
jgi:hypothetical protein